MEAIAFFNGHAFASCGFSRRFKLPPPSGAMINPSLRAISFTAATISLSDTACGWPFDSRNTGSFYCLSQQEPDPLSPLKGV